MTIPTIEYRGYELRAYSHQEFPLPRDPYAKGDSGERTLTKTTPSFAAVFPTPLVPLRMAGQWTSSDCKG